MMISAEAFKKAYKEMDTLDFGKAASVLEIIKEVREKGDEALRAFSLRFDKVDVNELLVPRSELEKAWSGLDEKLKEALELSKRNIEKYQKSIMWKQMEKAELYQKVHALRRVGIYVPGGKASYPSTVLMTAVLARVAGVEEIIVVTPPQKDGINRATLAACYISGVDKVYQTGGAQAIAALAYGTETIPRVDKIVGPGNQYVALAKKLVYGDVGIDSIAGPSEIVIVADHTANREWVALDILAQAEHDEMARTFLISSDEKVLSSIEEELSKQKLLQPRIKVIEESLASNHYAILTSGKEESIEIVNLIAGEHVSIQTIDAGDYVEKVRTAGAIFIGEYSPEAIGDYSAGPSHVLPTSGNARFASGLSVNDFLRTNSVISLSRETFMECAAAAVAIANEESLSAHRDSVSIRMGGRS
jgi:histidinol dehydrogenase